MTKDTPLITVLCEQGHHGTTERRYVAGDGWRHMWTGLCAGSVFDCRDQTEHDCECPCHAVEVAA